jgi:hypothetical protein
MIITGKINLTKMDAARIFKGQKGEYLDITLIETPDDKFGNDYMIIQSVTKEERLAGKKGPIVGNAKRVGGQKQESGYAPRNEPASQQTYAKPAQAAVAKQAALDEDVPF